MAAMTRLALALPALLAGCGQDIDLGNSRMNVEAVPRAPAGPSTKSAGCPFEDPGLLKAPAGCPDSFSDDLVATACVVGAGGPVPGIDDKLPAVPACPTGVYFTLGGSLPAADALERAVLVLKGDDNDKSAFAADTGTPLPRTVEVFPDRRSFFVRLDPRPSDGLRVNVMLLYAPAFGSLARFTYGYVVGFHAGEPSIP